MHKLIFDRISHAHLNKDKLQKLEGFLEKNPFVGQFQPFKSLSFENIKVNEESYLTSEKLNTISPLFSNILTLRLPKLETIKNVNFLKNFPKLQQLHAINIDLLDASGLSGCKDIKGLDLSGNGALGDFTFLEKLPHLIFLSLEEMNSFYLKGFGINDFSFLGKLKQLEFLNLSQNPQVKKWTFLEKLKNLKFLILSGCNISEADQAQIKAWLPKCAISF